MSTLTMFLRSLSRGSIPALLLLGRTTAPPAIFDLPR